MSTAYGGQVLLSSSSAELVRGVLPEEGTLRDMGEHRLKGLVNPERLWQLVAPDLLSEFPPLTSLNEIPNNLPAQPTALIGREAELAEVVKRLSSEGARLLTLTGPGGIGKTRMALQAAAELIERFKDGVFFVDLAQIRDPASVPTAIAQTLGFRETGDRTVLDELKGQLRAKTVLLLLDNFEQVTTAAPKVGELLRDCPQLKLLVTSREALHVRGEYVFPVPPLMLPKIDPKQATIELLTQYEAVQLFIERAQAIKPDFMVTNENAPAVAEICWRLDGLPLAIELAAARIRLFSPQAILERLGSRLKLLRGGARDLPVRQQTLRDAIDWSFELLNTGEQQLFELLSVFSGGCSFEAVEMAASGIERLDEAGVDILEGLTSLVDKSLIRQVSPETGEPRLLMLETIREFAVERLDADPGFCAAARRAHATYYADFTQRQWERLAGHGREAALTELISDLENLRTAWGYWVEDRDLEKLGKFVDGLWLLYDARGWYRSTIDLTKDMLDVLSTFPPTPERIQQEILLQTGLARALQVIKGFTPEVEQAYTRALELSQAVGEIPELFPVLRGLGSLYGYLGEFEKAGRMAEKILSMAERLDDPGMQVEGHIRLGYIFAVTGKIQMGLDHLEKAIADYDPDRYGTPRYQLGNNYGVIGLNVSALLLWMVGLPERALERANHAVALARRLDHPYSLAYALFHAGLLHLWRREADLALMRSLAVLEIAGEHEYLVWSAVATCLRGAALAVTGQAEEGLAHIHRGIDSYQGLNTAPIFLSLLIFMHAEVCALAGKPTQGLAVLDKGFEVFGAGREDIFSIESYRIKGDLLLAISPPNLSEAERSYLRALEIAQEQGVIMLELRAAIRLARLWKDQAKAEQGKQLLGKAYEKFSEGFTTPDLVEARELLKMG
ncbi:MAG: hypothetical protein A2W35_15210 [Chloroflexi bacterium RBG_16_57_11]|nr:MAG: hypothetical protein A2W35_15210 [Chloroflexi bacterium RBG_16_57_11]